MLAYHNNCCSFFFYSISIVSARSGVWGYLHVKISFGILYINYFPCSDLHQSIGFLRSIILSLLPSSHSWFTWIYGMEWQLRLVFLGGFVAHIEGLNCVVPGKRVISNSCNMILALCLFLRIGCVINPSDPVCLSHVNLKRAPFWVIMKSICLVSTKSLTQGVLLQVGTFHCLTLKFNGTFLRHLQYVMNQQACR